MKKVKAFTLIELIVVMAILVGVLTAILQLMQPVTEAFNDSTEYERQRTVENGIITYITESVRYANKLSICDEGVTTSPYDYVAPGGSVSSKTKQINSETDAVTYFCEKNKIDMSDDDEMEKIQVIRIDRSTNYDGNRGRLIRRNGWESAKTSFSGNMSNAVVKAYDTKELYMAMGPDYYNGKNYTIVIPNYKKKYMHYDPLGNEITGSDLVEDNVSQLPKGFDVVVGVYSSKKNIGTQMTGSVTIMNYTINICDIDYQTSTEELFGNPSTSSHDKDTYIVFTRPN